MKTKLSILIVAILLGLASFQTYTSYLGYVAAQKRAEVSLVLKKIESLLDAIESERMSSVRYMVTGNKNKRDKLKEARVIVDGNLAA